MEFVFDKTVCKNLRRSLRKEWLETNSIGGYASSSLTCCNTRKYHGLLVVKLDELPSRYVLLSAMEESLAIAGREAELSCRKYPELYAPRGHEFLQEVTLGKIPTFIYQFGEIRLCRQIMMLEKQNVTLIRYSMKCEDSTGAPVSLPGPVRLRLKPLLAYRDMHALTMSNIALQVKTWPAQKGFSLRPYNALPPFFMQSDTDFTFHPSPDWYYNVEYMLEADRGFPNHEDLFQPGVVDFFLQEGQSVVVSAATEDVLASLGSLEALWDAEVQRREQKALAIAEPSSALETHLRLEGQRFLVTESGGNANVVAGYPWFECWGRDTCIALTGLTFASGQHQQGWDVLNALAKGARDGRIPNMFSSDGNHAFNCIDASLWYAWAAQAAYASSPEAPKAFREHCWPFLKTVIEKYASGIVEHVQCDAEGFLQVGSPETQLTWMDAHAYGKAVTPRYGFPVEINALWYNLLAFARVLAKDYGERYPHALCHQRSLDKMRKVFKERFWVEKPHCSYLADCWRPEGLDKSVRPNQLFAVGLPFPILDEEYWGDVVETCRNALLTPYGMRTLSPEDQAYEPLYKGNSDQRDSAYHQGTVWPWLIGIYGSSLLRAASDTDKAVEELLETLSPLLTTHLTEAGVGSISEILVASPPHLPDGCFAQAWSVAEVVRLLGELRQAAPHVVQKWEQEHIQTVVRITF